MTSKDEPESKQYTALSTSDGELYQFNVMPFRLCGAVSTFQRLMSQEVLVGLLHKNLQVYLDDLIIYSKTHEEHLLHLAVVFERFEEHGLRIATDKCIFGSTELEYLAHAISGKPQSQ